MNSIGIYIHIPFCEKKCPYCDFFSVEEKEEFDNYVEHVVHRISELGNIHKRVVSSIYFGGGTPSLIGTNRLVKIINSVKNNFTLTKDAEITLEVNPCSSDKLDFASLISAGFNRLSVGLQSAVEKELKVLGRRHNKDDAKNTVLNAKKAGFRNISLDLMLCVPGQTKSSLTESIKFCKNCDVEHISAYILKYEENTPFYINKDSLCEFDEDNQAQMYAYAVEELNKYGYIQYEISNFAKVGYEGRHNLKYWRDEEYLGIGPSAHTFIDGNRYYYPRSIQDFYDKIIVNDGKGGDIEEYIMLALRLKEGLSFEKLYKRYNYSVTKSFIDKTLLLQKQKLVIFENDTLVLTTQGFLVSNSIINYLLSAI